MYIEKIAHHLGRRDEVPNQELAALLAEREDAAGIAEIAGYLDDPDPSIASDCLKVLYEIGYLKPELITGYTGKFLELLDSRKNRMVWGAMIGLANVAPFMPDEILPELEKIHHHIQTGTVITNVWGVKTIIGLAKAEDKYYQIVKDDLLRLQKECRPVDFAKRAEDMWVVIRPAEKNAYLDILKERLPVLSNAAQKRLKRVIRKLEANEP